ncbi:hypothetical protein BJX61DRAFT_58628 [Aspergillus egyptiacus]|nr:hypothetical protein BJX61DRAFT_58628 [Aspergillus egyptiacus]
MPEDTLSKNKENNTDPAQPDAADENKSNEGSNKLVASNADTSEEHKPQEHENGRDLDPGSNDGAQHADNDDDEARAKSPILEALRSKDRFDALVRDRDSLRAEVTDMRKSLEEIQSKHQTDMEALQSRVQDAEAKKEHAESQFRSLLERVNTIKSQLGERLKEDAEEISQARSRIEELEEQNFGVKEEYESKVSELSEENQRMSRELAQLRERTNLSQQNWLREKDELLEQESYLQSEFEQAKEAMHNWEVLAMEERSIRENLGEKVIDLEEQLASVKDAFEKVSAERESQAASVDGLQRALQEIQAGELLAHWVHGYMY